MTQVTLNNTYTTVRGGGYGSDAWIARITGTDPKFGFVREFCRKDTSGLSGSGRSGSIGFDVTQPGLYEFRSFCVGSTPKNWEWSGFVAVAGDEDDNRFISRAEAMEIAREMDGAGEEAIVARLVAGEGELACST